MKPTTTTNTPRTGQDAHTPTPEHDGLVRWLSSGKTLVRSVGLVTTWRLRNGWIAMRRNPENKWSVAARWTIFDGNDVLGGAEGRLTRAIATVLNENPNARAALAAARNT